MDNNIVYVKTKNGIFKCYKSETMHKPIYHPVNGSGYIDYNDVEKILSIDDLFEENQELKNQQKEFIEYLENKISELNEITKNEEDEETIHYALVRITAINEILSKYNEITEGKNGQ